MKNDILMSKAYRITEQMLLEGRQTHKRNIQGEHDLLDKMKLLESKSQTELAQETVSAVRAVLNTVTTWNLPISTPLVLFFQSIVDDDAAQVPLMQLCKDEERGYLMYMRTAGGARITVFLNGDRAQTDYWPGDGCSEEQDVALQGEPAQVLTDITYTAGISLRSMVPTDVQRTDDRNATYGNYFRYIFDATSFGNRVFDRLTPFLDT